MISFLKGNIHKLKPTSLELDVKGVGYFINISLNAYEKFQGQDELFIYTHLSISENNQQLFGFYSEEEKELFTRLISVNGVGPRVALNVLSGKTVTEICSAIVNQDILLLKKINGIGSKTAERIVLELKDKIKFEESTANLGNTVIKEKSQSGNHENKNYSEAVMALVSLGYKKVNTEKVVKKLLYEDPFLKLEDLIKMSLKHL